MIELWPRGTNPLITDFQQHGIRIHPSENSIKYEENGQFNIEMVVPVESGFSDFDYGQIIRATVPKQHLAEVNLGEVSYYEVTNEEGTSLLKTLPSIKTVNYTQWQAYRSYSSGDKRTYNKKNWRCTSSHGGLSSPPPAGGWTEISRTQTVPGEVVEELEAGTVLMMTADFNDDYIEAATLDGAVGYVDKNDVTATGETEERTVPARDITKQNFVIVDIKKTTDGKSWRIYGEHISYQLKRTMLGDCNVASVTPATALLFIKGAMQETYGGNMYTDLTNFEITADWSWKNAQNALLDPKSGVVKLTNARVVRDDLDVFILSAEEQMPVYAIRYGTNMKGVTWDGTVTDIVTRVYPIAQKEDGSTLLLPEKYIDSVRDVPFINPEPLNTGLKIGQKEKKSDGTEVELTEDDVITRMREMANNRFNIDKCDQAEIKLDLDWIHMPDTEEYAQYRGIADAAPGDWVQVYVKELKISELIRMTGYVWDAEKEQYKGATFGTLTQKPTVAGYNLKSGSVNASAIARNSVTGLHIQEGSLTAREIEANSITADLIASRSIVTELLAAGAITADEIAANSITTEKLAALSITTEKLAAQAITTDKLDALAVTAAKIAAGTITADKIDVNDLAAAFADVNVLNAAIATIAEAEIGSANIGFAQIKDASVQNLIAHDAVTDKYYIDKLAVRSAQMVQATVGELIIKASDDHYYRLDVNAQGALTPTDVTSSLTNAEKTAGVTSDGHSAIIETDLTVNDLSASNMKAINALIDKLTASRIDVQELFARQATITQLNTVDIRGNQYLQLMVAGYGTTYTQWTDPASEQGNTVKDGDVWYKGNPMTHSQMASYTHSQLSAYTHKGLEGYQQFIRKDGAWKLVNDPVDAQQKIAMIALENDEIALQVKDTWSGIARLDLRVDSVLLGLSDLDGNISQIAADLESLELTVGNKYDVISGIAIAAAGVAVSGSKYIKLDVNSGNYVHIDQNGIEVMGNRIKVNGEDVFARDDIIVMKPNATDSWRRTVAGIENHMATAHPHDWVLIRPYYDARILWNLFETYAIQATTVGSAVKKLQQEAGLAQSFGTATTYQYVFKFTIPVQNFTELGVSLTLASNSALTSNVVTGSGTFQISAVTPTTLELTMNSAVNLCAENAEIWFKLEAVGRTIGGVSDISLTCKCDATVSRVPCSVYYYV